jgi:poly(A) polymerase
VTDAAGKPVKKAIVWTKNEHGIDLGKIDPDARRIITVLRQYGFAAYIVGGAVRDLLIHKTPKDFDLVTDAPPPRIKRLFYNARVIGKRFRLVHVIFGKKIFEVSTFRSTAEGTVGNNFGTIHEDVMRRDFTLNALYYDPVNEYIVDYVGGVQDIRSRKINPVIPLPAIFVEDPVRMVRAVKYAAATGFSLPFFLRRQIKTDSALLGTISPSRITEELVKILNSGYSAKIVKAAFDLRLYPHLQPAAAEMCRTSGEFRQAYMRRLALMDAAAAGISGPVPAASPLPPSPAGYGEKLGAFIHDYVLTLRDWEDEKKRGAPYSDLYAFTWAQCRRFVLPMNPQRSELEYAVRYVLAGLGIVGKTAKKRRTHRGGGRQTPESRSQ